MKQNINCQLTNIKIVGLKHFDDPKAFTEYLNDIGVELMKILKKTIQIKNIKHSSYLVIWLLVCLATKT